MTGFLKAVDTPANQTLGLLREDGQVERCVVEPDATVAGGGLSGTWYVDAGTAVPALEQDGSIGFPFATLAAAVAAAQADFTATPRHQTIWLTPFDYSAEGLQTLTLAGKSLALASWQLSFNNGTCNLPALNVTGDLSITGCTVTGVLTCTGFVTLQSSPVIGLLTANQLQAFAGSPCLGGGVVPAAEFYNSPVGGAWTVTTATMAGCRQNGAAAFTGLLQLDGFTAAWARGLVTSTLPIQVYDNPTQETVSVVVPAVLAGQVGYVDTAFVAALANVPGDAPIVGNPTADLVGAGAGGGFINCRVPNTGGAVRCAFVGPLAGGAVNFKFAALMFP